MKVKVLSRELISHFIHLSLSFFEILMEKKFRKVREDQHFSLHIQYSIELLFFISFNSPYLPLTVFFTRQLYNLELKKKNNLAYLCVYSLAGSLTLSRRREWRRKKMLKIGENDRMHSLCPHIHTHMHMHIAEKLFMLRIFFIAKAQFFSLLT